MNSVCVLLSSYNGERYIIEQIDSVLSQVNVDVHLIVRDDGSSDKTLSLLKKYGNQIEVIEGENVGPARSFLELVRIAPEYDYYAFCDQDDVWDQDKLEVAVKFLENENRNIPLLYYSNLRIVDENLKYFRLSHSKSYETENKYSALMESLPTGCTIVYNKCAEQLMRDRIPDKCTMHDTWVYIVCKMFGKVKYDNDAHISYRQHGNNVIGTALKRSYFKKVKEKFLRLFDRNLQPNYENAIAFFNAFYDLLNEEDQNKLKKIVDYKTSVGSRLVLLFDKDLVAGSKARTLQNKVRTVLGIL